MSIKRKKPLTALRALGDHGLPDQLRLANETFDLVETFKHDFFAATAMYARGSTKVVAKWGRIVSICKFPLGWIGRHLTRHEAALYSVLDGLPGIPRCLGMLGTTGFVHEHIEGRPLQRNSQVPDDFFPALQTLIDAMHEREVAYVDLEKPENILLGCDGRPYLFDFQISWYLPPNRLGRSLLALVVRNMLQSADRYHLLKHWRRIRPDQLTAEQLARSYRPPIWIAWHRYLFRPLTLLRRRILVGLGERASHHGRSPG